MELTEQLVSKTKLLLTFIETAKIRYLEVKSSGKKTDFQTGVKPFADEVGTLSDEWSILAINWVSTIKPKSIHRQQIEATVETTKMIAIQSFYPETSRVRFLNYISSVIFVLNGILLEAEKSK